VSTQIVKSEIQRFLASATPEVLCIRGKWGVGKTFAWMQYLGEAERDKRLGLDRYAYVSLFGLNDLEALRYSIFESTVASGQFLHGPDIGSLRASLEKAGNLRKKALPLAKTFLNSLGLGDAGEALSRAAFLSVRNQLVCIDDLERAGDSLRIRDVLGLASMLKEQRQCKVVLLLNDERLDEIDSNELKRQLEKVVDVSLTFEPTADEAAAIAFPNQTAVTQLIREKTVKLGITNIRVIKKIERLANRLIELLSQVRPEIQSQGIHAIVLGGWSVLQPDNTPPTDFIRRHNRGWSFMKSKEGDMSDDERRWTDVIEAYGWSHCDDLDDAIFDGVIAGYFDEARVLEAAREVQAQYDNSKENSPFSKAWRRYHDSFSVDDDVLLDALFEGAKLSLPTISPLNMNGTTVLLREFGWGAQADELIALYVAQPELDPDWLDEDVGRWGAEPIDPRLLEAFNKLKADTIDTRDPKTVLVGMVANSVWNEDDIVLLGKQSPEDFVAIFESAEGPGLRSVVKFALSLGAHEGENYKLIGSSVREALRSIAARSPLRRKKIESYGVTLDPE
jgi:hypothetical protein